MNFAAGWWRVALVLSLLRVLATMLLDVLVIATDFVNANSISPILGQGMESNGTVLT